MENKTFNVLGTTTNTIDLNNAVATSHWSCERIARHNKIVAVLGKGIILASFIVDTNHPNGLEIHTILDNGVIIIQNRDSKRIVTELIARPNQISRYWFKRHLIVPTTMNVVLAKAEINMREGRNYW